MSFKNIKDGWLNYIKSLADKRLLEPEFREEVDKRAELCTNCPELRIFNFTSKAARGKCKKCGCMYPALIFAPQKKCPIGKWDKYES